MKSKLLIGLTTIANSSVIDTQFTKIFCNGHRALLRLFNNIFKRTFSL